MDRDRLQRLVLERMRATLDRVSANAAYASRLGGAVAGDLKRLEDWQRPPR